MSPPLLSSPRSQIAYHTKGGAPAPQLPSTRDYAVRIAELAEQNPLLLVVYAHTLYLALLSGGQLLESMLRGTMLLPAGRGTAIFRFDLPRREHAQYKRALRAAVDELGKTLTEAEMAALLQEKRSIFWRNDRLIAAVFKQDAKGSPLQLALAWLRVARAAMLSLLLFRRTLVLLLLLLAAALLAARHALALKM